MKKIGEFLEEWVREKWGSQCWQCCCDRVLDNWTCGSHFPVWLSSPPVWIPSSMWDFVSLLHPFLHKQVESWGLREELAMTGRQWGRCTSDHCSTGELRLWEVFLRNKVSGGYFKRWNKKACPEACRKGGKNVMISSCDPGTEILP